jgi:DNA polymerase III subunit beta
MTMQLVIERDLAVALLTYVVRASEKRGTLPVLSHVRLHANGALHAEATDLYTAIGGTVGATITGQGTACALAKPLLDRMKRLAGLVELSALPSGGIALRSGKRVYEVKGCVADDFPVPATDVAPQGDRTTVRARDLYHALERVLPFSSTDETRPHLNGVAFEFHGAEVRLIATDGHRLAKTYLAPSVPSAEPRTLIVSRKSCEELLRLCKGEIGSVAITADLPAADAKVTTGRVAFDLALADGTTRRLVARVDTALRFPPYEQVIPAPRNGVCVQSEALLAAVQGVAVSANARTGAVVLDVTAERMAIQADNPEEGRATDEVPCVCGPYGMKPYKIGVNARYVVDTLRVAASECVIVEGENPLDPIVMKLPEDDTFVAVIMPMRV